MTVLNASRSMSSTAVGAIGSALAHRVVDAIGEQRPVRQVGERVVERLVPELGFEAVALRDVLDRDEHRVAAAEVELVRAHLDVDAAAVLQLVAPHPRPLHARARDVELGQQALGFVVRVHVGDEPIEELLARVAVVMDRGFVHLQEVEPAARRTPTSVAGCRRTAGARWPRSRGAPPRSPGAPRRSAPARRSWCRAGARRIRRPTPTARPARARRGRSRRSGPSPAAIASCPSAMPTTVHTSAGRHTREPISSRSPATTNAYPIASVGPQPIA